MDAKCSPAFSLSELERVWQRPSGTNAAQKRSARGVVRHARPSKDEVIPIYFTFIGVGVAPCPPMILLRPSLTKLPAPAHAVVPCRMLLMALIVVPAAALSALVLPKKNELSAVTDPFPLVSAPLLNDWKTDRKSVV